LIYLVSDLNYRIEETIPTERALFLAEKNQLGELLACDQLNIERQAGRCFQTFEEGPIAFPPTYKYQPGTDVYDTRPEKKIRAPAWCDRILFRTSDDGTNIQLLSYHRSERPNVSDHKPVYSTMQITIKDVIVPKREAIYVELMKLLDRYENQSLPTIALDRVNVPFGLIRYEESKTIPIRITNTGSVVAQYRFVPKPDETGICKLWCSVKPTYGMLIPGDQPSTIDLTITLKKDIIHRINNGREVLDDVLILRLENGRDYYISINAEYARSCYGMSVDELVLYTDPIRMVPIDPVERTKMMLQKQQRPNRTTLCVPKELWRILDAIYEMKGYMAPNLFIQNGHVKEMNEIRECLDTGHPLSTNTYSVYSYADVFVQFLSSLSIPIISYGLCPTMEIDSQNIQMYARRVLDELPPIHYNVFIYVISFFREVFIFHQQQQQQQQQTSSSSLTSTKLARIACTCLLASSSSSSTEMKQTPVGDESENNNNPNSTNDEIQKRTGMTLILLHLLETNTI
jgi:inositol polyphosphate 5-phosphatase INPP5B/F